MRSILQKPVLLVIDMQKDFFTDGELCDVRQNLVQNINTVISRAREKDIPIIWVKQEFETDLSDAFLVMRDKNIKVTIKDTEGAEILDELDRKESDLLVIKKRYSAFFQTPLEEILKKLSPSKLILTGINTHACIRAAAIDAYQRNFRVVIPSDCVHSWDKEHHEVTLKYLGCEISQVLPSIELEF